MLLNFAKYMKVVHIKIFTGVLSFSGLAHVHAQPFPAKPIRIITSAPSGSSDFTSRLIAHGLTERLGQQVIVDNRGNIGGEILARAPADGYSILVDGASLWITHLVQSTPYDPLRDFAPLTIAVRAPNVIVIHPSPPVTTVRELIAYAKTRPGQLNYASGGIAGASHLCAELFKSLSGINLVNINYKGTGPAISAILSGESHVMFANATIATAHLQSAKVRALAVASPNKSPLFPQLPSLEGSGITPFEGAVVQGVLAPAKTPAALISKLHQDIAQVLNRPDVKERHFKANVETVAGTPDEFAAAMRADIARWGKVIKEAGIKVE